MKKSILFFFSVMLLTGMHAQDFAPAAEINQRLGRGINMGNAFEAPTETEWNNPWKPEYFKIMSEMGFSHVRIPIRWSTAARTMTNPPYTISSAFMLRIQQVVDTALKYQLHPIINMHHHQDLLDNVDEQEDRFLAQWQQIATHFKDYPDSLLFEIFNEPHGTIDPPRWNLLFREALDTIRETNPRRVVLIGTAPWGGLEGVSNLDWPDDDYLILTVHYYSPFQFTHQGAEWVSGDSNAWLGTQWKDTEAERDAIINDFNFTKEFAELHNIPVHVGEFGAYYKADLDSRVRWTTFLARWFEQQGFSWAYWEFSAGFGIYNPNTKQINQSLTDALLHNPMPDPIGVEVIPVFETDFSSGSTGWNLGKSGTGAASMTLVDGQLNINITNAGRKHGMYNYPVAI
jgi:endoglucanase